MGGGSFGNFISLNKIYQRSVKNILDENSNFGLHFDLDLS
jgi:hypothetical protein